MKTVKFLQAILLSCVTGCGTVDAQNAKISANGNGNSAEATPSPTPTMAPSGGLGDDNENTAVAYCKVSSKSSASKPIVLVWKYYNERMTYTELKENMPSGYRLPTRSEVLTAIDNNALAGYGRDTVWVANRVDDNADKAWTIRLGDGYMHTGSTLELYFGLYVREQQ